MMRIHRANIILDGAIKLLKKSNSKCKKPQQICSKFWLDLVADSMQDRSLIP
jgi:hypothetical protein